MKHLLSNGNLAVLAQLAGSHALLAFDFDGTLAPIVAARGRAQMRARTRKLFARVCELYPCAVISGRSRDDVLARVTGADVKYVIGNHGLEPGYDLASFERVVSAVTSQLEAALAVHRGVEIENKRYSLAVHFRNARLKNRTRLAIEAAIHALPEPMRIIPGKLVVNAVPARAPHKGDALQAIRAEEAADTALYVGDDVTDEDVFELDEPGRLFSIRVGKTRRSAAAYYLRDQPEIDALLSRLQALRASGRP